ncbi:hypothetical protein M0811_08049 [Anaeramoeba ignava]|uniref:Yos1-like protein n=1 Tax=Anaeramoeba ignava TaxID=1746090 RepID=A0A9Q0RC25_ANAIG|nr:hypothetical protein M0811_08049 [Anaeramoeba ignava]
MLFFNFFSTFKFLVRISLLFLNSVLILNERRFLAKYDFLQPNIYNGTIKNNLINFLNGIRYLRLPVAFINILWIIYELLFG